jgi:hypothetical protein
MPRNIEKFDLLAGRILADLYERFPLRIFVAADAYGVDARKLFSIDGIINRDIADELEFFCSTLRWLYEAGYLSYKGEAQAGVFSGVVLSARGLEVLKAMPKTVSPDKPLGEHLRDTVRSGATHALKNGVAAAMSAASTCVWHTPARQ